MERSNSNSNQEASSRGDSENPDTENPYIEASSRGDTENPDTEASSRSNSSQPSAAELSTSNGRQPPLSRYFQEVFCRNGSVSSRGDSENPDIEASSRGDSENPYIEASSRGDSSQPPAAELSTSNGRQPPLCRYFQEGICRNGSACRFQHVGSQTLDSSEDRICIFYKLGRCRYSSSCRFRHIQPPSIEEDGKDEGDLDPTFHSFTVSALKTVQMEKVSSNSNQEAPKTQQVSSSGDAESPDAKIHGINFNKPLAAEPSASNGRQPPPCRYFGRGSCRNGNACRFQHGGSQMLNSSGDRICIFYQQGSCRYGNSCRFRHIQRPAIEEDDNDEHNPEFDPELWALVSHGYSAD